MEEESAERKLDKECVDTDELAKFRSQWKEELGLPTSTDGAKKPAEKSDESDNSSQSTPRTEQSSPQKDSLGHNSPQKVGQNSPQKDRVQSSPSQDAESEATSLYWMGAAAEQGGDMNGALLYYQRALQLDPNVDLRASRSGPPASMPDDTIRRYFCESNLYLELLDEFERLSLSTFCQPRKPTKETHISVLPVEVLRYILRWVASSQLDMRAVEQVSMVCKGFYLLAREPQLWRSACMKIWGRDCEPGTYNSWRKMFILKPHLHFNGVYISKTSYVRLGERSLDGFYKPFHTVTYFRYLRFFADGSVMYQTTPEEPSQVVSKLRHKHSSEAVLLGNYQVQDRTISIALVSVPSDQKQPSHHRGRGRNKSKQAENTHERQFHMELLQNKRKTKQLTWIDHYCITRHIPTGQEQVNHFSINYMYTPFHFSGVRSFTLTSTGLLYTVRQMDTPSEIIRNLGSGL